MKTYKDDFFLSDTGGYYRYNHIDKSLYSYEAYQQEDFSAYLDVVDVDLWIVDSIEEISYDYLGQADDYLINTEYTLPQEYYNYDYDVADVDYNKKVYEVYLYKY